jgi:pSer/pThr/pTyr-binding forkhead associated (FHA) protein
MKIVLEYISAELGSIRREFIDQVRINLGRKPDNHIVFNAPEHQSVSGFHAQIEVGGSSPSIHDLGSSHGTFLNGRPVTRAELKSGDQIRLCPDGPVITVTFALEMSSEKTADPIANISVERSSRMFGQKTVALLIQRAIEAAGLNRHKGTSKPTAYFEAMLEDRIEVTTRRHRIALALLAVVIVLILIIAGIIFLRHRNVVINQTTQLVTETAAGGAVATGNRSNVFVLAGVPKTGAVAETGAIGFCTAFAISPNLLATNAHCVLRASRDYLGITVHMNGGTNSSFSIVRMVYHPGYLENILSPDVGLIQINGRLSTWANIASTEELQQIVPGVPVFLYGFPGRLNNLAQPEATFVRGEIGRLTTFAHGSGSFAENTLLQHSAFVSQGTSGSPMFNAAGNAIGVATGGYSESGQALPGYNFGMRIDLLAPLIRGITEAP